MAANAAHSGSEVAEINDSDIESSFRTLSNGLAWLLRKPYSSLGTRRLLSIRRWNQAHPAARNTLGKHRVLGHPIRSSGMPAQTKVPLNVLSGEKPAGGRSGEGTLLPSGLQKPLLPLSIIFVPGFTIRVPGLPAPTGGLATRRRLTTCPTNAGLHWRVSDMRGKWIPVAVVLLLLALAVGTVVWRGGRHPVPPPAAAT